MADNSTATGYTKKDVALLADTALAAMQLLDLIRKDEDATERVRGGGSVLRVMADQLEYAAAPFMDAIFEDGTSLSQIIKNR